jgi:hypothetical protein
MKRIMMVAAAVLLCALVFTGCDPNKVDDLNDSHTGNDNTGNNNKPANDPWDKAMEKNVTASEFASTLKDFAPGYYKVNLTENIEEFSGITMNKSGVNVALKGAGVTITCKRENQGPLFNVQQGTLVIEDITILVTTDQTSDGAIIRVEKTGNLEIRNNAVLRNMYNGHAVNIGGGNVTMLGGEIRADKGNGINFDDTSDNASFTMKGGAIKDNGDNGIGVNGPNKQVTIEGNAVISGNNNGISINQSAQNCVLTIKGSPAIHDNGHNGVAINGINAIATIEGNAAIEKNTQNGIVLNQDSNGCSLTIKGNPVIRDNRNNGVAINGKTDTVTIDGNAVISGNNNQGISINQSAQNCVLFIKGSSVISDNGNNGVAINGKTDTVTIDGNAVIEKNTGNGINMTENSNDCDLTIKGSSVIRDNGNHGVIMRGNTGKVTITAHAVIRSNADWGLVIAGANSSFTKDGNSVIYGNTAAAANKNGNGAIRVEKIDNNSLLELFTNADEDYAAAINAAGTGIESQSGDW